MSYDSVAELRSHVYGVYSAVVEAQDQDQKQAQAQAQAQAQMKDREKEKATATVTAPTPAHALHNSEAQSMKFCNQIYAHEPAHSQQLPSALSPPPAASLAAFSPSNTSWNAKFQAALDLPEKTPEELLIKNRVLTQLSEDFTFMAELYGKVIICEKFLPNHEKSIPPAAMGGIAGGQKYIVHGMLFKFAQDTRLDGGGYLYGGR